MGGEGTIRVVLRGTDGDGCRTTLNTIATFVDCEGLSTGGRRLENLGIFVTNVYFYRSM